MVRTVTQFTQCWGVGVGVWAGGGDGGEREGGVDLEQVIEGQG